jgi:hypothetical protein
MAITVKDLDTHIHLQDVDQSGTGVPFVRDMKLSIRFRYSFP